MRFTPVPVSVLIPPTAAEYITPRTIARQNFPTAGGTISVDDDDEGSRWSIPVATGIIMTTAATLCIHMLTNAVVAQIPRSSSGAFSGSTQNTNVIYMN